LVFLLVAIDSHLSFCDRNQLVIGLTRPPLRKRLHGTLALSKFWTAYLCGLAYGCNRASVRKLLRPLRPWRPDRRRLPPPVPSRNRIDDLRPNIRIRIYCGPHLLATSPSHFDSKRTPAGTSSPRPHDTCSPKRCGCRACTLPSSHFARQSPAIPCRLKAWGFLIPYRGLQNDSCASAALRDPPSH
jgi:hypothetical protein